MYQPDRNPHDNYLTQLEVRSLVYGWTRRKVGNSSFFNWKDLLGERKPGQRQLFYSNYLLAKFVSYADKLNQFGYETEALNAFWDELETFETKEDYINATIGNRASSEVSSSQTPNYYEIFQRQGEPVSRWTVPVYAQPVS